MSKREKLLAAIVASLVLLLGVFYGVGRIHSSIRSRRQQITRLEQELAGKKLFCASAGDFQQRLDAYRDRSLPADLQEARSLYKAWLVDCALEVGLTDPLVKSTLSRTSSRVYQSLAFTISGQGNLKQLIEFLYRFYSANHLHRIRRLHAKRTPNSKMLDLTFSIEALSLFTATHEELNDQPSDRLAQEDLAAYLDAILSRNPTGPPNNEPRMETIGSKTAYTGRTLEFTVATSDPDRLDEHTYQIDGDGLPGARIDAESGRFEWRPEKPGQYEVVLRVSDDGWPQKSHTQTVKITVTDPPPPPKPPERKPSFELAKFAFVTAITEASGRRQAWITLRTEGKVLKLHEGDQFNVGEVGVTVQRINEKSVEMEAKVLQRRMLVSLGQNLWEADQAPREGT